MTVEQLKNQLQEKNVPEDMYSLLKGGYPNEAFCLINTEDGWEVYYSERGQKSGCRQFSSESEACEYMERKLMKYARK